MTIVIYLIIALIIEISQGIEGIRYKFLIIFMIFPDYFVIFLMMLPISHQKLIGIAPHELFYYLIFIMLKQYLF